MRLLHGFAFSKKLRWLAQTKVITLKTHVENDCRNSALQPTNRHAIFTQLKLCFNVCVLIFFSKFLYLKKQVNQFNMQKNYGIDNYGL